MRTAPVTPMMIHSRGGPGLMGGVGVGVVVGGGAAVGCRAGVDGGGDDDDDAGRDEEVGPADEVGRRRAHVSLTYQSGVHRTLADALGAMFEQRMHTAGGPDGGVAYVHWGGDAGCVLLLRRRGAVRLRRPATVVRASSGRMKTVDQKRGSSDTRMAMSAVVLAGTVMLKSNSGAALALTMDCWKTGGGIVLGLMVDGWERRSRHWAVLLANAHGFGRTDGAAAVVLVGGEDDSGMRMTVVVSGKRNTAPSTPMRD